MNYYNHGAMGFFYFWSLKWTSFLEGASLITGMDWLNNLIGGDPEKKEAYVPFLPSILLNGCGWEWVEYGQVKPFPSKMSKQWKFKTVLKTNQLHFENILFFGFMYIWALITWKRWKHWKIFNIKLSRRKLLRHVFAWENFWWKNYEQKLFHVNSRRLQESISGSLILAKGLHIYTFVKKFFHHGRSPYNFPNIFKFPENLWTRSGYRTFRLWAFTLVFLNTH